jgi:HPr kinase/phosphorylase
MLKAGEFFQSYQEPLRLTWIAGRSGEGRPISGPSFESADLVGHLNLIHANRIQVLGTAEADYFNRLDPQRRSYLTAELLSAAPPAIVMADGLVPPASLFEACDRDNLPLWRSTLSAAQVIEIMRIQLGRILAPSASLHGVFMDVLGLGVLISGESGQGKSELALELITRGHGLVADDIVDFSRIAPDAVEGRCPPLLRNLLEVRGLGLLDIRTIFGETSVRRKMRLRLIVQLVRRSAIDDYERLPLEAISEDILGLPIRKVVIPVAAGRNLAVLVEAAVRNTVLQLRGIDTMREFTERQRDAMQSMQDDEDRQAPQ